MSYRINRVRVAMAATVFLSLFSSVRPERAGAQDAETTASARALFEEGVALSDRGDWPTAADRLRRSYALRPSSVVAFNLARADIQIGRLVEASELLRPIGRDAAAQQRLRDAASALLTEITPRIARLRIELRGDRSAVTIALDGRALPDAAIGVERPTDPGERVVTATRDDVEIASGRVTLAPGGSDSVTLELPRRAAVRVATPTEAAQTTTGGDDARSSARLTSEEGGGGSALPWILVGTGAAVAIAATVIIIVVVGGGGATADPVPGNLQPGVIEFGG